jgi:hypothetical protein
MRRARDGCVRGPGRGFDRSVARVGSKRLRCALVSRQALTSQDWIDNVLSNSRGSRDLVGSRIYRIPRCWGADSSAHCLGLNCRDRPLRHGAQDRASVTRPSLERVAAAGRTDDFQRSLRCRFGPKPTMARRPESRPSRSPLRSGLPKVAFAGRARRAAPSLRACMLPRQQHLDERARGGGYVSTARASSFVGVSWGVEGCRMRPLPAARCRSGARALSRRPALRRGGEGGDGPLMP